MNNSIPLEILRNHKPFVPHTPVSVPETETVVAVGQIRSIRFVNSDDETEQRFVIVTSMTSTTSLIVQGMLVGTDFKLSGKNDVLLHEEERPSFEAVVAQTDLRFPVLRSDLGALYSKLNAETLQLFSKMNNYSGRDVSRSGVNRDASNLIRQDYLRDELDAMHSITQSAFAVMAGPDYKAEKVKELDLKVFEFEKRAIRDKSSVFKTELSGNDRQAHIQQRSQRRAKEMVAA
jgi:hypothetical protein